MQKLAQSLQFEPLRLVPSYYALVTLVRQPCLPDVVVADCGVSPLFDLPFSFWTLVVVDCA